MENAWKINTFLKNFFKFRKEFPQDSQKDGGELRRGAISVAIPAKYAHELIPIAYLAVERIRWNDSAPRDESWTRSVEEGSIPQDGWSNSNSPFQRKFRLPSSWDDDGSGGWIGRVVFHSANEAPTTWRIMISPWWWDSAVKCTYGFDWWTVRSRRKMDKFLLEYRWMGWKLWAVAHFFRFVGLISIFVNKLWSINTISRCDNYVQFSAKICIISSTQFHSLINGEGLEIFHPLFSTSMRKVRSVNRMVECTSVEKTRLQKG